jgi:DNA-binding NtrC family response regulator
MVESTEMSKTILLVSRDKNLQNARARILEGVGYRTIKTSSLTSAVQLSSHCQMSIIGHTFNPKEQDDFIDSVHEANPSVYVLCLRCDLAQPQALLDAVASCFASQPGGVRICIFEGNNVIAWPKRAS